MLRLVSSKMCLLLLRGSSVSPQTIILVAVRLLNMYSQAPVCKLSHKAVQQARCAGYPVMAMPDSSQRLRQLLPCVPDRSILNRDGAFAWGYYWKRCRWQVGVRHQVSSAQPVTAHKALHDLMRRRLMVLLWFPISCMAPMHNCN